MIDSAPEQSVGEIDEVSASSAVLSYARQPARPQRRVGVGFLLAACFCVGYIGTELLIWCAIFGVLNRSGNSGGWLGDLLFDSMVTEVFYAVIGGAIVAFVFSVYTTGRGRLRLFSLALLAGGLGGLKTGIPWIINEWLHLFSNAEAVGVVAAFILPLVAAHMLVYAARYQSDQLNLARTILSHGRAG